jgi:hypothetical protein
MGLSLSGLNPARADLTITLDSVVAEDNYYRWTYAVNVNSQSRVGRYNYFTIYDIGGLVPGSMQQPDGWGWERHLVGVTPTYTNPPDNPDLDNISWFYGSDVPIEGPDTVGLFSFLSSQDRPNGFFGYAASETFKNYGVESGTYERGVQSVYVPVDPNAPAANPEPSSLLLLGIGVLSVAGWYRHRRKATA